MVPFSGIFRFIRNSRGDELGLVELTFYGGLRTSGGTKILLRTDHGAVFVDFGMDFELEGHYFDEPWDPPFYIPSLLQIGALPDIEGLYRMKPGRPVDGVLVSHPHLDHVGHVPLLSPQIPVYAGTDTKALTNIRSETHDHDWKNDWSHTDWRTFSSGDVVDIEGTAISFMPLAVDHSVLGSYGFIIQAEDKKIAYTGDLRLHGRRPEQTEHFLNLLRLNHIDALISEGTHVEPGGRDVEADLVAQMEAVYAHKLGPEAPHRIEVPCITEDDVEARLAEIFRSAEGSWWWSRHLSISTASSRSGGRPKSPGGCSSFPHERGTSSGRPAGGPRSRNCLQSKERPSIFPSCECGQTSGDRTIRKTPRIWYGGAGSGSTTLPTTGTMKAGWS